MDSDDLKMEQADDDLKLEQTDVDLKMKQANVDLKMEPTDIDLKMEQTDLDLEMEQTDLDLEMEPADVDLQMEQPVLDQATRDKKNKKEFGEFNTLFYKYRSHDDKFFEYSKTSMETFDYILDKIQEDMKPQFNFKKNVSTSERLFLTLRFLSHGGSLRSLSQSFGLGRSTVSKSIYQTLKAIWSNLHHTHIPKLTADMQKSNAELFYTTWQFPACLGALDEKHFRVTDQPNDGSAKRKYWLVLQGVADARFKFTFVEVSEGKECAGKTKKHSECNFHSSRLNSLLADNKFNVPQPEKLPGSDLVVPYVLVGGEVHPLKTYLMRPYPRLGLDEEKRIYNERISKARVPGQCAFGILTSKFGILSKSFIEANAKHAKLIIKVACLIHNIVREIDGDKDGDFRQFMSQFKESGNENKDVKVNMNRRNRATNYAVRIRDRFKDHFVKTNITNT